MYQKLDPLSPLVLQALGLHLPDPPLESEDEDEEGAAALSSHSSIPMDPEHVELVKREKLTTNANVNEDYTAPKYRFRRLYIPLPTYLVTCSLLLYLYYLGIGFSKDIINRCMNGGKTWYINTMECYSDEK